LFFAGQSYDRGGGLCHRAARNGLAGGTVGRKQLLSHIKSVVADTSTAQLRNEIAHDLPITLGRLAVADRLDPVDGPTECVAGACDKCITLGFYVLRSNALKLAPHCSQGLQIDNHGNLPCWYVV
jgi:hypothetical protein